MSDGVTAPPVDIPKIRESCRQHAESDQQNLLVLLAMVDASAPARPDDEEEIGPESQLVLPLITAREQAVFHDVLYRALFRHAIADMVLNPSDEEEDAAKSPGTV